MLALRRVAASLLALLAFCLAQPALAQTTTSIKWSSLGATSMGPVVSGSTASASDGTVVTVNHSFVTNGGTFVPAYTGSFLGYFNGTIGGATDVLLLSFDNNRYDPADKVTVDMTLSRAVTGLQFSLTDIDTGGFQDAAEVYYDNGNGTWINAAYTPAFWSAPYGGPVRQNDAYVDGWIGTITSGQTSLFGDLRFNFGTTAVKRIRIVYFSNFLSGKNDPSSQYTGISGLTFNTSGADLSLAKSALQPNPASGSSATFRLTVANAATSTATATGITVKDSLPAGFIVTGSSGTGSFNSATGVWTVGTLAPGASATLDITGIVDKSAGTTLVNTAEITASSAFDPDSTPNNSVATEDDYATATMTVGGGRAAGTIPTLTCAAGSTLFDWTPRSWTAGSTDNSYALGTIGNVRFALSNPGTWVTNATYGGQSPTRQSVLHGATNDQSLLAMFDLASQTAEVTTTITLPTIMRGAQFKLLDVDYNAGQFADRVRVEGRYKGAAVAPTLTNGVANYVSGSSIIGDGASDDSSANGNATVTFTAPIDTIILYYGNHTTAPANPGVQGIALHDITFCKPTTTITAMKTSAVISDPVTTVTGGLAKAIPGAVVEYCLLFTNTGDTAASAVSASDIIPANLTFVAGSMRSGSSCAAATTTEDDDAAGSDESDPSGASYAAGTVTATTSTLAASASMALKFRATVN